MGQIRCYKCGSLNVDVNTTVNNEFSVKKGLLGRFLFGPGGSAMGINGKKTEKITYHCKDCGENSFMCMDESMCYKISKAIRDNDEFTLKFYKQHYNNIEWEEKSEINKSSIDLESEIEESDDIIVELENGIKEISKETFSNEIICVITKVIIPSSVTVIKKEAFKGFISLKEISFDLRKSELTTIEDYAFSDCNNLEQIHLPFGIQKIGEGAFYNCKKFCWLAISPTYKNIREIGRYAFNNCDFGLVLGMNTYVEKIGKHAFPEKTNIKFFGSAKFKSEENGKIFDTRNPEDLKTMFQYDLVKI